ncbi:EAL domain-containing protein [Noviherbaspirillum sp. Root189]|uniref:EAL domain-containing protein n=1 Tax=Noviherbaspirillum sp. Root189 TaxID=1736487 RepID=UPI000708C30A|nr:EAL domain-containing protein [Noviherbaspirillum sp. Root189]KRB79533.1 hypothetical protein ASE07_25370 [Noviherbaspirillum sp. Root189]
MLSYFLPRNLRLSNLVRLPLLGQLAIFFSCVLSLLWLLIFVFLQNLHDRSLQDVQKDTANLVRVFAEEVHSSVGAIDLTLIDLREWWKEDSQDFANKVRLHQSHLEKNVAFQVSIINPSGMLVFSSADPNSKTFNLSDREHFLAHRNNTQGGDVLFISEPVLGRVSQRWSIQFTRSLLDVHGKFAGVIVLSVSPDYFTRFSRTIGLGSRDMVALIRADGKILARAPIPEYGLGKTLRDVPSLNTPEPKTESFQRISQSDGIYRQYTLRSLSKYGLTVGIGRSIEDLLDPYRHQRNMWLSGAVGVSALLGLIGFILFKGLQDRVKARVALEQSEFRWKYALEGAGEGVWDWNNQTDEVFYSTRWKEMLGYAEHDIKNRLSEWKRLVHPDDKDRVLAATADYLSGKNQTYANEYRLRTKNGRWIWVFSRGMIVSRDATGHPLRTIGAHSDITERKRAEETTQQIARNQAERALILSEQRFRQLADAMPQIVWTAEPDGTIDYGNETVAEYTGLKQIDIASQNWITILHPDDVNRTLTSWADSVRTGNSFEIEYRLMYAVENTYRWHLAKGVPIRDESGTLVKWYGSTTDIHDRKLASDEIRRLAARLTTILESITEAFFTLNLEWQFTYINKETESLLQRDRTELLGKVLWEEYPALIGTGAESQYRRAMANHCSVTFEIFYTPLNRWFGVRVYPSSDGLTVYFRDISERRHLELFKLAQMEILERIATGVPISEVLITATSIIESLDPTMICSVMLLSENGSRLNLAAAPRLPAAFCRTLDGMKVDPAAAGPCGRAAFEKRPVFASDISDYPMWASFQDEIARCDIRACWSYPILSSSSEVFGTFAVYSSSARSPEQVENEILGSCAHTVSIAIERQRVGQKARENEQHLRLRQRAIEASANAIAIGSAKAPHFQIEYVNPAFDQITGYAAADVIGKSLLFLCRDDFEQPSVVEIRKALIQQCEAHAVIRAFRNDGSPIWIDSHVSPVRDENGIVTHFVYAMSDITAARQYQAELEYQSNYDSLTGLANRNLLRDRVKQTLMRAETNAEQVWIVCINLDRFKFFNDTLGHEAGNVLLQLVACRLQTALGTTDTAARLAGDEFVLVLADAIDELTVTTRVQRLMDAVAYPLTIEEHDYFLSCTIGISVYPSDGDNAEALLKHADIAMHRAKEIGRNSFQFYTAAMNFRAMDRLRLEGDLRLALQRNELLLHYQPQVDVRTCRIVGMEALLRWQHPQLGLIPPDRFIRIAEETGLIIPIGTWAMRTACLQSKKWQDAGHGSLRIGVNLSGNQFYQKDLVQTLAMILEDTGLDARCLDIELTEGLVMTDIEHALDIMHRLKTLGVKLSLDDFGTGYSSLSYLKRFPIDVLKIDQSFVRNITTDPEEAVIARSIITLAKSLQLEVIAEGVETEQQLGYLRRHRCDQIQGYYFSRPLPPLEFEQLLVEDRRLPQADEVIATLQQTLLIVDDEENVSAALNRLLRRDGYRILRACSAEEGLSFLALYEVQVVISDQRMPGMPGTVFLSKVKELYPNVIRIMLSGYTAVDSIIEATNSGAVFRFHTKPWDDDILRISIAEAFRYHWLLQNADPSEGHSTD